MNSPLRVLKNSAALSISVLLERGVGFFLPWYIARVEGREIWGQYSTALAFIGLSSMFASWGLDQLLPRQIARDRARVGPLLTNASIVGGLASILTAMTVVATVGFLNYPSPVQRLIWMGVILVLFPRTESLLCESTISGLERMEWIAAVRFPVTILRVALSLLLLSRGFGVDALFVVLCSYYVVVWVAYLTLVTRCVPTFRLKVDPSLIGALFVQAVPFVATISIGEASKQIDRVLLSKLWDTDSVGLYSTGIMLVQVLYLVAPAIMNALFPMISRVYVASQQQFSRVITRVSKLLLIGTFPVSLTIITFASPFILLVFGQDYASSVAVLRVYAIGIMPSFVGRLLYRSILASDNERLAVRVALVNSAASVALNVLLIPNYGMLGAAVSGISTEFLGLIQNLLYLSRTGTKVELSEALLRPWICILASAMVYWGVMQWSFPIAWVVSIGVFTCTLIISGTISRADLALVSAVRRRGGS